MTPRAAWVLGVVVIAAVIAAVAWTFFKPTHRVEVDVDTITGATPNVSGMPTPIIGDLVQAMTGRFEPHFPYYSDFIEARKYASEAGFQFIVKGKLPEG